MIEIIIATFNRIDKASKLAYSILDNEVNKRIKRIIIVDSTDQNRPLSISDERITYIETKHQNQPYQRYLGYCASKADYIIFFDDDMEISNHELFEKSIEIFNRDEKIVALAYNFADLYSNTSLAKIPRTNFSKRNKTRRKFINFLTGYPSPGLSGYGLCGTRGPRPSSDQFTELIGGGAFAARRETLYKNFNFQLFDLYENRLGKGEDGILGYSLSKQGRLYFINEVFVVHNDQQNSVYTSNMRRFARRVAYSRLYLSLEKCRLDGSSLLIARVHYHYYMFWRLLGLFLNYLLNPSKERKEMLFGSINGWWLAVGFRFDKSLSRNEYWHNEAMKDLSK